MSDIVVSTTANASSDNEPKSFVSPAIAGADQDLEAAANTTSNSIEPSQPLLRTTVHPVQQEAGEGSNNIIYSQNVTTPLLDDSHHYVAGSRTPFMESPVIFMRERFEAGSIKGSVFTLVVAIVGAGTLSVPFAMEQSGLLLGSVLFILGACLSLFSLRILLVASQYTGGMSYKTIAERSCGKTVSKLTQISLLLNLLGTTISYLVAAGNMIAFSLQSILNMSAEDSFWLHPTVILCSLTFFPIVPLSLLRTMGALRFSSLIAVGCVFYLTLVVVIKYFEYCTQGVEVVLALSSINNTQTVQCFWEDNIKGTDHIMFATMDLGKILSTVPIVVYAYTCHPNVLPVFLELRVPNKRRMLKVTSRAIGIAMMIYLIAGCFGYLTFRTQLEYSNGNFLLNDYHKDPASMFGALGMASSVVLATPMLVHAFRENFYQLLFPNIDAGQMSSLAHISITLMVLSSALLSAITIHDISKVFSVLGSTTNPIICYFLPCLFLIKSVPRELFVRDKITSVILCIVVFIISGISLVNNINSWS